MEIKLFQKTQRDLAASINLVIDQYWDNELTEHEMMELLTKLHTNNENKLLKNGNYTTIIRQQCGKRRLEIVTRVLK